METNGFWRKKLENRSIFKFDKIITLYIFLIDRNCCNLCKLYSYQDIDSNTNLTVYIFAPVAVIAFISIWLELDPPHMTLENFP